MEVGGFDRKSGYPLQSSTFGLLFERVPGSRRVSS